MEGVDGERFGFWCLVLWAYSDVYLGPESEVYAYNILLRVYNMNGHTFSPSEFLEQMKEKNVTPNMASSDFS